jgi:hypothetical protein
MNSFVQNWQPIFILLLLIGYIIFYFIWKNIKIKRKRELLLYFKSELEDIAFAAISYCRQDDNQVPSFYSRAKSLISKEDWAPELLDEIQLNLTHLIALASAQRRRGNPNALIIEARKINELGHELNALIYRP